MSTAEATGNEELFDTVWQNAIANIEKITSAPDDQKFLKSLAMGGSVGAESLVSTSPALKQYWGNGDLQTATKLSLLFSMLMLSQLYRWVQQHPPESLVALLPKEVTATRIVHIFDGNPDEAIEDFFHFDEQVTCDLEKHPHLVHTCSLLMARCSEICGHPCIDWSKVKWPVIEMTHLVKGAITDSTPMRSKLDIDAVLDSINTGSQAMTSYYSRG